MASLTSLKFNITTCNLIPNKTNTKTTPTLFNSTFLPITKPNIILKTTRTHAKLHMFEKAADAVIETLATTEPSINKKQEEKEEPTQTQPITNLSLEYLTKWPMWVVGPSLILATGVAPTLWLPISAVFVGPNAASLLALTGLDCLFNLGATLFLLMSHACAHPPRASNVVSEPPLSCRLFNIGAAVVGLVIPIIAVVASEKGWAPLQPRQSIVASAVLVGPYMLLLTVQALTELLTWHWRSPVWVVTPVVYETYRVLQLMRGLRLGLELGAPAWTMHGMRGLVSMWVLVLAVQLMRVAWFAGLVGRIDIGGSDQGRVGSNDDDW